MLRTQLARTHWQTDERFDFIMPPKQKFLGHKSQRSLGLKSNRKRTYMSHCPSHVPVKTNFRRYVCYILPNQTKTNLDHFKVFYKLLGEISVGFDNRWRISPKTPIMSLPKVSNFYNEDLWEFLTCCGIWMKFCTRVHLKHWNDWGEFGFDWARSKKISSKIRFHWLMKCTIDISSDLWVILQVVA